MEKITLRGDFTVSRNHGAGLEFSSRLFDRKGGSVTIVYEMHNGTFVNGELNPDGWLGPKVVVVVSKDDTVITKLDGTTKTLPNIDFSHAAVQGLVDVTRMNTFLENQGGDLRTEP